MSTGTTAGEGHDQPFVRHVTITYAHGGADSDQVHRLLRRVGPRHAPLPISTFVLEDLTPDSPEKTITWNTSVSLHRVPQVTNEENPLAMNHDLAAEFHRRAEEDQAARRLVAKTHDGREMCRIDVDNTSWLKEVIAEHGWPGVALVGDQGTDAAWLLAQHADLDPAFQRQALELLKAAVAAGDAPPRHLAYLTDRVLVAGGEPQVYGTQYTHEPDGSNLRPQPVADPERLDERRAEMGLEPAAEYDRRMHGC